MENDPIVASVQRLKKLQGALAYCEAARLPHRLQRVQQMIAAEEEHLERLKEAARQDPHDHHMAQLHNQCQHCMYHRFYGACRLSVAARTFFGLVARFEQPCRMEHGHECNSFRPTNASPLYEDWLRKRREADHRKRREAKAAARQEQLTKEYIKLTIDNTQFS